MNLIDVTVVMVRWKELLSIFNWLFQTRWQGGGWSSALLFRKYKVWMFCGLDKDDYLCEWFVMWQDYGMVCGTL